MTGPYSDTCLNDMAQSAGKEFYEVHLNRLRTDPQYHQQIIEGNFIEFNKSIVEYLGLKYGR